MDEDHINQLIEQIACQEDEKSFEQLFLHFYDQLYKFAYSYIQNKEASEEVVSDIFLTIWQNRKTLHQIQNIKVYLYVAVKNQATNYLKKNRRVSFISVNDLPLFDVCLVENPESQLLTKELKKEIDNAIEELPGRCRIIFQLIRIDGLKYKEVAEVLDISVKTVENQVSTAMQKLGTKLAHHLQNHKTRRILKTGAGGAAIIILAFMLF